VRSGEIDSSTRRCWWWQKGAERIAVVAGSTEAWCANEAENCQADACYRLATISCSKR